MHAKSQILPDLPRRLGAPRQRALRRGSRITPKKHSTTAGGTTLSLCPFPAGRQAVAAASSHPHALRACSSFESLRPFGSRLSHIASENHKNTHNTQKQQKRIQKRPKETEVTRLSRTVNDSVQPDIIQLTLQIILTHCKYIVVSLIDEVIK